MFWVVLAVAAAAAAAAAVVVGFGGLFACLLVLLEVKAYIPSLLPQELSAVPQHQVS